MTRRRFSFGCAVFCAAAGVWDLIDAIFIDGGWLLYVAAAFMAACVAANLYFARQRKADPAVAPKDNSLASITAQLEALSRTYAKGGYVPSPTPPKKPEDFKGLPFDLAVGEVYGLRMWRMDQYGRLTARNWKGVWKPGVNEAECIQRVAIRTSPYSFVGDYEYCVSRAHEVPSESCSCGFYAYTDPQHAETKQYAQQNGEQIVLGIVKGTGRTLLGTKGFRCEKAEIVALRDPTRGGEKTDPWRLRQAELLKRVYPDVPLLPSRAALLEFAPLTNTLPDPSTDEFWSLP